MEHQQQQQQRGVKREIPRSQREVNPGTVAGSMSLPRKALNPNSYPPEIAKFMTRVRNSMDLEDPTQQDRMGGFPTPETARTSRVRKFSLDAMNDLRTQVPNHLPYTEHDDPANLEGMYDVPRLPIAKVNVYDGMSQSTNVLATNALTAGPKPRSRTNPDQPQLPPKSFSMPRGQFTPAAMRQFASSSSRETTPSSITQSDIGVGFDASQGDQHKNPRSAHHVRGGGVERAQTHLSKRPPPLTMPTGKVPDSLPSSPTFFTHNHPHRSERTPSPNTQSLNKSFQEHLNSLQPSKGSKTAHVMDWMEQNTLFWKKPSFPMVKDPNTKQPPRSQPRMPHLYEPAQPTPTHSPGKQRASKKSPVPKPVQHLPQHTKPASPSYRASSSHSLRGQAVSPHFNSSSSLTRNPHAVLGHTQSAKNANIGDDYFVLDV